MPIKPTLEQLHAVSEELGLDLGQEELALFNDLLKPTFRTYDRLNALPDYLPEVRYPRTPGHRPSPAENQHNAWYVLSPVRGAPAGALVGKTVALKDTICLAGVPMMNGSTTLEGYIPDVDATVVVRVLDAGGVILGKTNCEHFCLSAGSHTNPTGPTHNPYRRDHTSGGSSSGSAVVVACGEADMALGGDQGGSIRVPAAFCGIVGMKPTHGLAPYTGIMPIEMSLDHTGPMTRTVADNALLLEVIAGPDGLDPRQDAVSRPVDYLAALGLGAQGLRIGVLREGFGHPEANAGVEAKVRASAALLTRLGAIVEDVSVPMHALGPSLWLSIAAEGATEALMKGNVFGSGWRGLYVTSLRRAHAGWRARPHELSDSLKLLMLLGQYFSKHHSGRFYAKAQNISRALRAAYDEQLSRIDVLLMPTTPVTAPPIPPQDAPRALSIFRALGVLNNTSPFNVTGHPAISVPCGMSDGLPVGMMLVAKHHDEATLYRAAAAFEAALEWPKL